MISESKKKLSVLVNSCDAYEDVWDLFFLSYREYANELPADIFLNTESKNYKSSVVPVKTVNYHSKNEDFWGRRLLNALSEIKSEYVLMVCDDFILEAKLDSQKVLNCLFFLEEKKDSAVVYLSKITEQTLSQSEYGFEELPVFLDYKVNSAPAIWRKDDLARYLGEIDTPWAWEYFGGYRSYFDGKKFFQVSADIGNLYNFNSMLGGAIYRGKWVRKVVEDKIEKYKLPINMNERGIADDMSLPRRSLRWKIEFFLLGYRMIGLPVIFFFFRALKEKFFKLVCS